MRRWFARTLPPDPPARADAGARVPPGVRVYAVGDVHGRLDLLLDLLDRIRADDARRAPARTELVLLGDLVDRGPDTAGVVALLRGGVPGFAAVHAIMGNHEEMLLDLLAAPDPERLAHYLHVGGYQTLDSYGVPERLLELPELYLPAALLDAVPDGDRAWFAAMADRVRIGDYLFVHAGVRPGVPLAEQSPRDLRWIRRAFLDSAADHGAVVVHGHSIADGIEWRPNRIGLDTGAFASGRLSALGLEGGERWSLATAGPPPARGGR